MDDLEKCIGYLEEKIKVVDNVKGQCLIDIEQIL